MSSTTELMASSEIEIFNSESKQIGSVSVSAETTAAEFWEQVHYSMIRVYHRHDDSSSSSIGTAVAVLLYRLSEAVPVQVHSSALG
jgi:hypothetical protein